jgi:predicted kinase|nr:MAG TPA: RNA ligase [Caudoviricetes sp.]
MRQLFILRGFSSSGKSSWVKENGLTHFTLSSDDYRLKLSSPVYNLNTGRYGISQKVNTQAWKNLFSDLEYRMSHGELTIVDATHLTRKSIKTYQELCKKYFYRMTVIDFDKSKEDCISDDKLRTDCSHVGEKVISKMKKEPIPSGIKSIKPEQFHDFIESKTQALDFNKYNKVHVIGDIHGCYTALMKYMDCVSLEDAVVFVGDYFDRGVENYLTFKFLYEHCHDDNFYLLLGNHEKRIMQYLRGEDVSNTDFFKNTLKYFKIYGVTDKMLKELLWTCTSFAKFIYHGTTYWVTHAGVPYMFNAYDSDDVLVNGVGRYEDMQAVIDEFESYMIDSDSVQVFGHRNNNDVPIKVGEKSYNVCGFPELGGDLKVLQIDRHDRHCIAVPNDIISDEMFIRAVYKYPNKYKIETVEQLVRVFRASKWVREKKFGDISSFNFTKEAFSKDVWDSILIKARGIFINTKTNRIVARGYDKFFNIDFDSDEPDEYKPTLDMFEEPFCVTRKVDGFLGILGQDEGKLLFCSKSMLGDEGEHSKLFEEMLKPLIGDEKRLIKYLQDKNVSILFEVINTEKDPHVLKYEKKFVMLLAIVYNEISYRKHYVEANEVSNLFDIENVMFKFKSVHTEYTRKSDIEKLKQIEGVEGFVVTDNNGKMFKVKTDYYQICKIVQRFKDKYDNIKLSARNSILKYPSEKKFKIYKEYYGDYVADTAYSFVCIYVDKLNRKDV